MIDYEGLRVHWQRGTVVNLGIDRVMDISRGRKDGDRL